MKEMELVLSETTSPMKPWGIITENNFLLMVLFWAAIAFLLFNGLVCLTECCSRNKTKEDEDNNWPYDVAPRYWHPSRHVWIRSNTPLLFGPQHAPPRLDVDEFWIQCMYANEMIRIKTRLSDLLRFYSSYFYRLYHEQHGDIVMMQNRIFRDLNNKFPYDTIKAMVDFLVRRDPNVVNPSMKIACRFFGIPELVAHLEQQTPLLFEDWIEQQSEALYYQQTNIFQMKHPFLPLDDNFVHTGLQEPVFVTVPSLPFQESLDLLRIQDRDHVYPYIDIKDEKQEKRPHLPEATTAVQQDLFIMDAKWSVMETRLDHLAFYRKNSNEYCVLKRALTAWKTRSLRWHPNANPVEFLHAMQTYKFRVYLPFGALLPRSSEAFVKPHPLYRLQDLIMMEAFRFLTKRKTCSLKYFLVIWNAWKHLYVDLPPSSFRSLALLSEQEETGLAAACKVSMPQHWHGPDVVCGHFTSTSSSHG